MINSKYFVRALMIDDLGFAIFNFDSIDVEFSQSNNSIAQLFSSKSPYYRYGIFDSIVGSV